MYAFSLTFLILLDVFYSESVGVFWHISDIHLNLKYYKLEKCYKDHPFANYECDSSIELFRSSLEFLKREIEMEMPDFISLTGDNDPHLKMDKDFVVNSVNVTTEEYSNYINQSIPFIPVVGNHDVFPTNEMDPDPASPLSAISWCSGLEKIWSKYVHLNGPVPPSNFSTGCYFSRYIENEKVKLVINSVNGLIWYANNKHAEPKPTDTLESYDPLGQFAWLESTLKWARENKAKVVNTNHFPMGAGINSPERCKNLWPLANEKLVNLYRKYSDVIMVHLVAHEHVDSFRVLLDESNQEAVGMFLVGPSVSPYKFENFGAFNPRMRKVYYDRESGRIIDYHQYYLDISTDETIKKGWVKDYEFLKAYKQTEITPKSLLTMVDMFEDEFDYKGLWTFYWDSELGHTKRLGDCAGVPGMISNCRCQHICAFRYMTFPELNNCLARCPAKTNAGRIIFFVISFVVLIAGFAIIVIINKRKRRDEMNTPIIEAESI